MRNITFHTFSRTYTYRCSSWNDAIAELRNEAGWTNAKVSFEWDGKFYCVAPDTTFTVEGM
jgi:hypothetical protein